MRRWLNQPIARRRIPSHYFRRHEVSDFPPLAFTFGRSLSAESTQRARAKTRVAGDGRERSAQSDQGGIEGAQSDGGAAKFRRGDGDETPDFFG